ncbi:glycosyltransferase family 4 protein [Enterobacter hormaechei]|uniref:glycosyltransferase family 4 protein n=1 Tax=Enterobacter hormaechei TaxID=158836 RepID=UPI0020738D09
MRVAFVDREAAHSIWSLIDSIAISLIKRGDEVFYYRFCDSHTRENRAVPNGVKVTDVEVPFKRSVFDLVSQHCIFANALGDLLRDHKVDVLHSHFAIPSIVSRWVAKRCKVPVIISTQHELYGSMSSHLRLGLRFTQNCCDAVTYISDSVRQSFAPIDRQNGDDVVIKNGIDVLSLEEHRKIHYTTPAVQTVICPGRFVPVKGQATLLNAWPAVLKRFPEARLCLPGAGPDEQKLKQRCQELDIDTHVDFPGWLPREETLTRIGNAQIMAVPSAQEGFGLVLAEAMALGVPLLCSDIPVFREVAGDTAGYFPVGEVQCLADAIIRILEQPEQARLKAEAGRERVCRLFDQRNMVAAYLALYDQLLERKR